MTPKVNPLVSKHLENIGRDAIEKYQKLIRQYVHGKSGVYALYHKDKLYYVGLAVNLNARLKQHLSDRHAETWDRFSVYLTQGDEHLREIEALLVRIASPKGNRQVGKLKASENLLSQFKADLNKMFKTETENIIRKKRISNKMPQKKASPRRGLVKPSLSHLIKRKMNIRFTYKGHDYLAVIDENGTISFTAESYRAHELQGISHTSLSSAGSAVTGKPNDGWMSWKYERRPGEWVKLDELRNKECSGG